MDAVGTQDVDVSHCIIHQEISGCHWNTRCRWTVLFTKKFLEAVGDVSHCFIHQEISVPLEQEDAVGAQDVDVSHCINHQEISGSRWNTRCRCKSLYYSPRNFWMPLEHKM